MVVWAKDHHHLALRWDLDLDTRLAKATLKNLNLLSSLPQN
jgi:hypothetical protein